MKIGTEVFTCRLCNAKRVVVTRLAQGMRYRFIKISKCQCGTKVDVQSKLDPEKSRSGNTMSLLYEDRPNKPVQTAVKCDYQKYPWLGLIN